MYDSDFLILSYKILFKRALKMHWSLRVLICRCWASHRARKLRALGTLPAAPPFVEYYMMAKLKNLSHT